MLHIIHVTSELAPIAKVGGLGDVVHGLAKEQVRAGHRVEVILPKYDVINYDLTHNLYLEEPDLWAYEDSTEYHNSVFAALVDGIETRLISTDHPNYYFSKNSIYGCSNDIERFLYFCRVTSEYLRKLQTPPDVIHLHDWPTATIAPLARTIYDWSPLRNTSIFLTIHSLEHQGKCHPSALNRVGLWGYDLRTWDKMQDPHDPALVNLLKGGISFSDQVTTVSPTYAKEIQTSEGGFGLDETIHGLHWKVNGILNGIELDTWNPATDKSLTENYLPNPKFIDQAIEAKRKNREVLLSRLNMQPNSGPLIVSVTRLVKQKGVELIQAALHYTLERGGSFILLGTCHEYGLEQEFHHIKNHYHNHPNLHMALYFNEVLARQIYAAADAIVIPSLFEPCGLTQMISMRYGTIPIARETGGLADTIIDKDDIRFLQDQRTGFLFRYPTTGEVRFALDRAFQCFYDQPETWKSLIRSGLSLNLGWNKSQTEYQDLYVKHLRKST